MLVKNNVLVTEFLRRISIIGVIKSFDAFEVKENFFEYDVTIKVGSFAKSRSVKISFDYHTKIKTVDIDHPHLMTMPNYTMLSEITNIAKDIRAEMRYI